MNNSRVRVSNKSNLEECLFASNNDGVKSVYPKLNLRNTGCAALDLAYVGCGRLDGYFHNKINLWDIAAGKIIIEEAGGKVNNINNFEFNKWLNMPLKKQIKIQPDELILPHPRIQDRLFVLRPLNEVDPYWTHPVLNKTPLELINRKVWGEEHFIKKNRKLKILVCGIDFF